MNASTAVSNETQERILAVLAEERGPVVSSTIKDRIDTVTRSAVEKQIGILVDRDVLDVVGEEDVGGGIPANVYALTDQGQTLASRIDTAALDASDGGGDGAPGGSVAAEVASLNEQIVALREKAMERDEEIEELRETVAAQSERIDELEATVGDAETELSETADAVETAKAKLKSRTSELDRRLTALESE